MTSFNPVSLMRRRMAAADSSDKTDENQRDAKSDEKDVLSTTDVINDKNTISHDANEESKEMVPKVENRRFTSSCFDFVLTSCERFQFKLYFTLLCVQTLPTIYKSVRIFYLGDLPNTSGVDIASQLIWVNLILEIFEEALILPFFHLLGEAVTDHAKTKNRTKIGFLITFFIHLLLCLPLLLFTRPLTKLMAQKLDNLDQTVHYIRLELINIPLDSAGQYFMTIMTILQWKKHIYITLLFKMALMIISDTCFISSLPVSLKFGVNGIAYANILTSGVVLSYCLIVTYKELKFTAADIFHKSTYDFSWLRRWFSVGCYSGIDSFVRNIFYMLCVIRMMNVIERQGLYWRANEFIWNWLLLLYIPLTNVLKQDAGQKSEPLLNHKIKMASYFVFMLLIFIIWVASIPVWKVFFRFAMNVRSASDADDIFQLVLILLPFYFSFMVTTLLNSVFYGKGKTNYLAVKSIVCNILINLTAFVLFLLEIYIPTIRSIALLFGGSMLLGFFVTLVFYYRYLKFVNYKL